MKSLLFATIIYSLVISSSTAQDYTPAIIYTIRKDSIVCQLKVQDSYTNKGSFTYRLESDKKSSRIVKEEIDSIKIGNQVFVFISTHYKYSAGYDVQVYEKIVEGRLSLYAKTHEQTRALSPGSGSLSGAGNKYYEYFIKKEGTATVKKIRKAGFKNAILNEVDRNDDLVKKVRNKEYTYSDLPQLITEYNTWYSKQNE